MAVDDAAAGDEDGHNPRRLLFRAESALRTLASCRAKAEGGSESVAELRLRLGEIGPTLGVDLREVQENLVEHAAMYSNCPEVLGGMLQLVFCIDVVCAWVAERDSRQNHFEHKLDTVESCLRECRESLSKCADEAKACAENAAALELAVELSKLSDAPLRAHKETVHQPEPPLSATNTPAKKTDVFCVDLHELAKGGEASKIVVDEDTEFLRQELVDIARELHDAHRTNRELCTNVEDARADAAAALEAKAAAEAVAQNALAAAAAATPPVVPRPAPILAMGSMYIPCSSPDEHMQAIVANAAASTAASGPPAQRMLLWLEQLEPMLATLPVGVVPGMDEMQEDACEAYAQLRATLWEATSSPHPHVATVPGGSQAAHTHILSAAAHPEMGHAQTQSTRASSSTGGVAAPSAAQRVPPQQPVKHSRAVAVVEPRSACAPRGPQIPHLSAESAALVAARRDSLDSCRASSDTGRFSASGSTGIKGRSGADGLWV